MPHLKSKNLHNKFKNCGAFIKKNKYSTCHNNYKINKLNFMVKDRTDFECVVVGAGILGLSVARSISKEIKVLVLEKNRRFGETITK